MPIRTANVQPPLDRPPNWPTIWRPRLKSPPYYNAGVRSHPRVLLIRAISGPVNFP
jgi:hypothetical protein